MSAAQQKAKPKQRKRAPIYLRCERLVRPETGEEVRAWTALTKWDARTMKDRNYHVGDEVRAEFRKPRNPKFNNLAHAIGALVVDSLPDFANLKAHEALKRLQRECGACCDEMTIALDLGVAGGKVNVPVKVPRSIAFDELDETEFSALMQAIYAHLATTYWTDMTPEAIEELVLMYDGGHA